MDRQDIQDKNSCILSILYIDVNNSRAYITA